jgi:tetratricopeptide (TPR) repeat protein
VDKAYRLASRLRDSEYPHYRDTYGWTRYLRGEYDEALTYIEPVLETLPLNAWVRYHLGKVYLALERPKDAQKHLQNAVDLSKEEEAFPPTEEIQTILQQLKDS